METSNKQLRWDNYFLDLCLRSAEMSYDPSTKVGAVIVGPDKEIRSTGFNGFPRGVIDSVERYENRNTKLDLIVHAEMNAILAAARIGVSVKNCSLYLIAKDNKNNIWGGLPCHRCMAEAIQAGISEIVSIPLDNTPSRWLNSLEISKTLAVEAGIKCREVKQ